MASSYFTEGLTSPGRGAKESPFRTYSNWVYPRTMQEVVYWALWLYERNAKYRSAIQKTVNYFIAGINVTSTGPTQEASDADAVESFKDTLDNTYEVQQLVQHYGIELAAMGNVYVSCERIFSRLLLCPHCTFSMALKQLRKNRDYKWTGTSFEGECPQCHEHVTYKVKDVPSQDPNGRKLRFVFRSISDMVVQFNELTHTYQYFYKMPSRLKDAIKRGDQIYLCDTPWVFIEAAQNDSLIEFPADMFWSDRTHTLVGCERLMKGFGSPLFLPSLDTLIRMQFYSRFNETIAMDYIAPMRIISPEAGNLKAGIDDPNRMPMSGASFRGFMQQSLRQVRSNPTTWVISPVPVKYELVGGEGKQLTPVDLMEFEYDQFLAECSIPIELKQTSFQVVAPSMGLRLYERQWVTFTKSLHKFTNWVGQKISEIENIENMNVDLDVTSFVEDDMNKQVLLSLMQGGVIAKTNVLKRLGVDFNKDLDQRMQEQKAEQEAAMKMQTQDEGAEMVQSVMPPPGSLGVGQAQMNMQAMMGGGGEGAPAMPGAPAAPAAPMGAPAGGAAPAGGGTTEQIWQEAMQRAQQLYNAPPNVRRSELVNLKATNPQLHSFVKSFLEQMEQDVASDAVAQSKTPQG